MNDVLLMDNLRIDEEASLDAIREDGGDCGAVGTRGGIVTRGADGCEVTVHTPAGTLVDAFTGNDTLRHYNTGIYIVSFKGQAFKVVVP